MNVFYNNSCPLIKSDCIFGNYNFRKVNNIIKASLSCEFLYDFFCDFNGLDTYEFSCIFNANKLVGVIAIKENSNIYLSTIAGEDFSDTEGLEEACSEWLFKQNVKSLKPDVFIYNRDKAPFVLVGILFDCNIAQAPIVIYKSKLQIPVDSQKVYGVSARKDNSFAGKLYSSTKFCEEIIPELYTRAAEVLAESYVNKD